VYKQLDARVFDVETLLRARAIGACGGVPFLPQVTEHPWRGNQCGDMTGSMLLTFNRLS
jgi:hypothetical protein